VGRGDANVRIFLFPTSLRPHFTALAFRSVGLGHTLLLYHATALLQAADWQHRGAGVNSSINAGWCNHLCRPVVLRVTARRAARDGRTLWCDACRIRGLAT